jgi:hypothetical protein
MHRQLRAGILAWVLAFVPVAAPGATVSWTGPAGGNWGTGGNWSNGSGPGAADTASFAAAGSSTLPGDTTNVLNLDRTVGGLAYNNLAGKFHTTDLDGHTLTLTGNLNVNLDQGQTTTTTIRNGTLTASGAFANVNVGRAVSGSSVAVADLSGLTGFNTNLQELHVGTSTAGSATGTLTLGASNAITAQRLWVGASFGSADTRGTLHLGQSNTIVADEFHVGQDNSTGLVDVVANATINLGTSARRTILEIANQNTNTNNTYTGTVDFKTAAVNLRLDSLLVAQKSGGPGGTVGQLLGGGSGTVTVGDAATGARGNWVVANTINGGGTQGTVDFGRLGSVQAYVNDFWVGRTISGSATGNVTLAATNTIDAANGILVGVGSSGGTLTLGRGANTLLTNQFVVGQDYSNGLVKIAAGGTLTLGSAAQRATLIIGSGTTNTNNTYTGKLDLTGGTLSGYLGSLTVGQKDGGPGGETGTLIGGSGGSIDIGPAGNTANMYVGRTLTGGQSTGIADFGGMATLAANLNALAVGTTTSGNAQGTLTLAAKNTINANTILVGAGGGSGTVVLGLDNTILTNQLTIGKDYANGAVTIPAGGKLTLGSPSKRANVTIATATTNTNETYTGTLDLTDATLVGYLASVVVGTKNPFPGGELGTFTVSTRPDNHVETNSITLAGPQSTGVMNFGGGELLANSIASGGGTATFNWTGGRLSVGTFGTPTIPFALKNTGTGTLAPGSVATPIGTTIVNGNYTQGAAAAMNIEIAGASPDAGNDQVNVSGSATLAGTLNLKVIDGYVPTTGQTFVVANYASRSGTFGFVAPPRLPADVAFQLDYATSPTQLLVRTVAPTQANWLVSTSSTTWSTPGNWDIGAAPGTTATVSLNNTTAAAKTLTVLSSTTVHRIALQGAGAPVFLEVPQGARLGVSNQLVVGPNATLTGAGEVLGDVVIGGAATSPPAAAAVLSPGKPTGVFAVSGNLMQQSTGVTRVVLAGTSDTGGFGRVSVAGTATLGGALEVTLPGGFAPVALDAYPVLTYASRVGRFERYVNLDVPGRLALAPLYSPTDLRLIATLPGDANVDGAVNFNDLLALARHYRVTGDAAAWDTGDFTYDGAVGFDDLLALARNYNQQAAPAAVPGATAEFNADLARAFAAASVPEPSALCAAAVLAGGMMLGRRRRR